MNSPSESLETLLRDPDCTPRLWTIRLHNEALQQAIQDQDLVKIAECASAVMHLAQKEWAEQAHLFIQSWDIH